MTSRLPRQSPPNWLPYLGFATLVLGVVYQSGDVTSRVQRNTERIAKLEASDAIQADKLDTINQRGARIEAKIDILVPRAKDEER